MPFCGCSATQVSHLLPTTQCWDEGSAAGLRGQLAAGGAASAPALEQFREGWQEYDRSMRAHFQEEATADDCD